MRNEQEIRTYRDKLIQAKHDYFGFHVQGLDLYYAKIELLDWILNLEKSE